MYPTLPYATCCGQSGRVRYIKGRARKVAIQVFFDISEVDISEVDISEVDISEVDISEVDIST
jgi:hypothetical protein